MVPTDFLGQEQLRKWRPQSFISYLYIFIYFYQTQWSRFSTAFDLVFVVMVEEALIAVRFLWSKSSNTNPCLEFLLAAWSGKIRFSPMGPRTSVLKWEKIGTVHRGEEPPS